MSTWSWPRFGRSLAAHVRYYASAIAIFSVLWAAFPPAGCRGLSAFLHCDGTGASIRAVAFGLTSAGVVIAAEVAVWRSRKHRGRA